MNNSILSLLVELHRKLKEIGTGSISLHDKEKIRQCLRILKSAIKMLESKTLDEQVEADLKKLEVMINLIIQIIWRLLNDDF